MGELVLPAIVEQRIGLERALEKLGALRERGTWLHYFNRELKAIDGQLSLVKATENAREPGLIPGYWHVKRDNPSTVASFLPIQGPNGEFLEPHSGVLADLRRLDLQRPGALEDVRRAQAKEIAARKKQSRAMREARLEEFAGRIKAADSPGVGLSTGWTKSVRGRRAR